MAKTIPVYGQIKGCTIYRCDENFQPGAAPAARDVSITLPAPTHPTLTIQQMGSYDIPDQTRVENMTLGVTLAPGQDAAALGGLGFVRWQIRFVRDITEPSGIVRPAGFVVWAGGILSNSTAGYTVAQGGDGTGELSMNLSKYKLVENGDLVHFDIDRGAGKLIINGQNFRAAVEAYY